MTAYNTKTDAATISDTWIEKTASLTELQELATEWGVKAEGNSRWRKSYFEPLKAERDRLLAATKGNRRLTEAAPVVEAPPVAETPSPAPVAPTVEDVQETIAKLRLYSALDGGLMVDDKTGVKAALKTLRDKHGVEVRVALNKSWQLVRPEAERILWAHKYKRSHKRSQAQADALALAEVETVEPVVEPEPAPVDEAPPVAEVEPTLAAEVTQIETERAKGVVVFPPRPVAAQESAPEYARRLNVVSLVSRRSLAPDAPNVATASLSDRLSASLRQRMGATAIALYNAAKGRITPQRAIALAKLLSSQQKGVIAA